MPKQAALKTRRCFARSGGSGQFGLKCAAQRRILEIKGTTQTLVKENENETR
jgi:hypothetical protein